MFCGHCMDEPCSCFPTDKQWCLSSKDKKYVLSYAGGLYCVTDEIGNMVCQFLNCEYKEEKNNPYPLCDNPDCKDKETCNLSRYMNEDIYFKK